MNGTHRFAPRHSLTRPMRTRLGRALALWPAIALPSCAILPLDPPAEGTTNPAAGLDAGTGSDSVALVSDSTAGGLVTPPGGQSSGALPGSETFSHAPGSDNPLETDASGASEGNDTAPLGSGASANTNVVTGADDTRGSTSGVETYVEQSDAVTTNPWDGDTWPGTLVEDSTTATVPSADIDTDGPPDWTIAPPQGSSELSATSAPGDDTEPSCPPGLNPCGPAACEEWLDTCVSDADNVRTKTPSSNACGFDCTTAPRQCSLTEDTYCSASCTYRNDADCIRPNRIFVTRSAYDGNLGGLSGADAKCQASADAADLDGTFIAVLGTSTTKAKTRLGAARGFIRVDDAPFADTSNDLTQEIVFNAPNINEYGEPVPVDEFVAAGFDRIGQASYLCSDWTSTNATGDFGYAGYSGGEWRYAGLAGCANRYHLYCAETSQQAVVRPVPVAGTRKAFIADAYDRASDLDGADARCMDAAEASGVTGTFKAFLASGEHPASARFNLTGAPWARIDGTKIVERAADLASGQLASPLNQKANGSYVLQGYAWTGMTEATGKPMESCEDWSSTAAPRVGRMGKVTSTGSSYLSYQSEPCTNEDGYLYCLEETGNGVQPPALPDARANVMFVTSEIFTGNLGGLSGADQKCNASAGAAGLSGTFVAVLGSATQSGAQRLGDARGFVRPDGLPIAASPLDFMEGRIQYPPNLTADGGEYSDWVWTGNTADCKGWTSSSDTPLYAGDSGVSNGGGSMVWSYGGLGCQASLPLYCAEVSQRAALPEPSLTGRRLAFIARGSLESYAGYVVDPGIGLAGLDAQCQSEASVAGLSGNYKALLATTTASAKSRFNVNGSPYARTDGVRLGDTAADFFADGPAYPITVSADGHEYFGNYGIWLGATDVNVIGTQTCNNWVSRSADQFALTTTSGTPGPIMSFNPTSCDSKYLHMICLQE